MAQRVLSELSICSPAFLARSKQTREIFFLSLRSQSAESLLDLMSRQKKNSLVAVVPLALNLLAVRLMAVPM